MSHIVLIGGHGKVALLATPTLIAAGHEVTSVFRNPEHSNDVSTLGATPVVADVEKLTTEQLAELMAGCDAVVWSAGAGGGNPERTYAVDRDAAIRSMQAAELAGVKRYVMVSYFNASKNHGIDPEQSFFPYAEAKAAADEHLRSSALDWTILGPSGLTLEPGSGKIEAQATTSATVSRANVAAVIVATLGDDRTIHRTICFNDGETPIAEAIGSF